MKRVGGKIFGLVNAGLVLQALMRRKCKPAAGVVHQRERHVEAMTTEVRDLMAQSKAAGGGP